MDSDGDRDGILVPAAEPTLCSAGVPSGAGGVAVRSIVVPAAEPTLSGDGVPSGAGVVRSCSTEEPCSSVGTFVDLVFTILNDHKLRETHYAAHCVTTNKHKHKLSRSGSMRPAFVQNETSWVNFIVFICSYCVQNSVPME